MLMMLMLTSMLAMASHCELGPGDMERTGGSEDRGGVELGASVLGPDGNVGGALNPGWGGQVILLLLFLLYSPVVRTKEMEGGRTREEADTDHNSSGPVLKLLDS